MNSRLGGLTIVLAAVTFMTVGCNSEEKKQIELLKQDNTSLLAENEDLKSQLQSAEEREGSLLSRLEQKDSEIAGLKGMASVQSEKTAPDGWVPVLGGAKVTVGTDILFKSGKAELTDAGKSALDKIAADLKGTYANLPVRVYGYTDSDPIRKTKNLWQDNLDLSANRAMAVTRYLCSKGISAENVETIAMGQTHPVAGNSTASGKAKNRRVEIVVIKS